MTSAGLYDAVLWPAEVLGLRRLRRRLGALARGRVLEVGVGTGLMLPHYHGLEGLVAADPDAEMLDRARARARARGVPAALALAAAEALPFAPGSFDTVLSALTLCSVRDPDAALREYRRVLKPGGRLLLLEHVRSSSPRLAAWQARAAPRWRRFSGGCHLDRDTLEAVHRAGFRPGIVEPRLWGLLISLEAAV